MMKAGYLTQFLVQETDSITESGVFNDTVSNKGIGDDDNYLLLTNNAPQINHGLTYNRRAQARQNTFLTQYDYTAGQYNPAVTLNFDMNVEIIDLFLQSIFQSNATSEAVLDKDGDEHFVSTVVLDADGNSFTVGQYVLNVSGSSVDWLSADIPSLTQSTVESYLSVLQYVDSSSSIRLDGGICQKLSISGTEKDIITAQADIIGSSYTDDVDASSVLREYSTTSPYVFHNVYFKNNATVTDIISFEIDFENQAQRKFGTNDAQTCYKFRLGRYIIRGNIVIPWNSTLDNLKDDFFSNDLSNTNRLDFYFSANDSDFDVDGDNEMLIQLYVFPAQVEFSRSDEYTATIEFEVLDRSGNTASLEWRS